MRREEPALRLVVKFEGGAVNRAILQACLPCLTALTAAFFVLWLLLRFSRAQLKLSRLWTVPRCERGSVQSLAFVLTMPAFIIVMLFIVQVSQLMVGIMVVHYSAYAGARAASVWLPAEVNAAEPENTIDAVPTLDGETSTLRVVDEQAMQSVKFQKIRQAVILACAPICPSRDLNDSRQTSPWLPVAEQSTVSLFWQMAPSTRGNPRIPARIHNKLVYADHNTRVAVEWQEVKHNNGNPDVNVGPTYNPRNTVDPEIPDERINVGRYGNGWYDNEIGWEDPVTVRVSHSFALLSNAGRFLAAHLVPADGSNDNVWERIKVDKVNYRETVYSIDIPAEATLTNEGYKSLVPYVQR